MKKFSTLLSIILLTLFLLGCGQNYSSTTNEYLSPYEPPYTEDYKDSSMGSSDNLGAFPDTSKIIYKADLSIETLEFDKSLNTLNSLINSYNGYLESSDILQNSISYDRYEETRRGTFVIRIPKSNFEKFIETTSDIGVVVNVRTYGDNVSDKYFDYETRLNVLTSQEEKYLELLKSASNIEAIIEIEKALTEIRYEIESLTGYLNRLDNLIDYSTINLSLYEVIKHTNVEKVPVTFGEKVQSTFLQSISIMGKIAVNLVLFIVALTPYLIVLSIITVIVILIVKVFFKRKK